MKEKYTLLALWYNDFFPDFHFIGKYLLTIWVLAVAIAVMC